jgi:hypothetical protein
MLWLPCMQGEAVGAMDPFCIKNKRPEPDPQYVYELDVLRAMIRQEDRQGDIGWGGTWTKENATNN